MDEKPVKRVNRRDALELFGALGAVFAAGAVGTACGGGTDDTSSSSSSSGGTSSSSSSGSTSSTSSSSGSTTSSSTSSSGSTSGECTTIPDETSGPYPDKTGMLTNTTYNRSDIAEGMPGLALTIEFTVVNTKASCASVKDATVMIWHCDNKGNYSEYQQPGYDGSGETFCRGYQVTDANGKVTFKTIYPGWYNGRAVHIHIEVFVAGKSVKVSQMAFPETTSSDVFKTTNYSAHGQSTTLNAADNVFADGLLTQMPTVTGDATSGFTASMNLGVSV